MSTIKVVFFFWKEGGKMSFADNIKRQREKQNISQKELAETVGVSQQAISLFEQGMKVPGIITAVDIAKKLGTTVEKLVEE